MPEKIEILEQKLANIGNLCSEESIDIRNQLAWEIGYKDLERAYELSRKAYELSRKTGYKNGLAFSKLNIAFYEYTKPDFASALRHCFRSLKLFRELKNTDQQGNAHAILGLIYWSLGNFDLAFDNLHKSEALFQTTNNEARLPWTLTTLGGIYHTLGDYQKALEYQKKSLELFSKTHDKLGEARALTGIGSVHQSMKQYKQALKCQKESLRLFELLQNDIGISRTFNDMGLVYQQLGDYEKALFYHKRSLAIRERLNNKNVELTSLLNLGRLYFDMNRLDDAQRILLKALHFAQDFDSKPKLYKVHQVLADVYEAQGDLKKALFHLKAYQDVKEEVFNNETTTKLKNAEIQHELEKSEKEAEIHRLKNIELKRALDNLRETQAQLIEAEKLAALGQFTAGITHEINNPIGAIKGSSDISRRALLKIKRLLDSKQSVKEILNDPVYQKTAQILENNFATISLAVDRIAKIVSSLKNFVRLDEASFKKADIHKGLESTLTLLNHKFKKGIKIVKDYHELPKVHHSPYQLNQVFFTLLQNANDAIENHGTITIRTFATRDEVVISIADSGRGMSEYVRESLFDFNFTMKEKRIGLGIGLFNAQTIIKRHRGRLQVKSREGDGTEFVITLPVT